MRYLDNRLSIFFTIQIQGRGSRGGSGDSLPPPPHNLEALRAPLEVFTGQIFSPNSSPPHEAGSKSIPLQIQNLMGQPAQSISKQELFYPYRVKILAVFVSNASTLAHICQSLVYYWDLVHGRKLIIHWPRAKFLPLINRSVNQPLEVIIHC